MTISAILGATTSGPTGSVYDQVWDYIQGVEYTNDCVGDFNFFVKDRMPSWILQSHPKFVKFIELFYQWLSCENDMAILESMRDVDMTPDSFIKLFKDVFAQGFPDRTETTISRPDDPDKVLVDFINPSLSMVDVRNFLRYVKTFYQMKSIEEAYDYFFRVFYDSWVSISYPKIRVIRCSEAPFRGASAGTTGAPCYYYGLTGAKGGLSGPCHNCWAGGSYDVDGNELAPPCPDNCAPGHPCGVYYDDELGTLSGLSKIQDSKIWQNYSYLIDSSTPFDLYWGYVKTLLHPAGLYAVGNFNIWDEFPQPGTTGDIFEVETPMVGFYTPYRFETEENLRSNSQSVDLYPCGWLPYLGGTAQGGPAGASYSSHHTQDSGGLWYKNEAGATAHEPRLAGITAPAGATAAPLGLSGHTGGTAAARLSLSLFHISHHPNSWSNEVEPGTIFKNIQLGQFLYLTPINTVSGSPNNPSGSTADCGF